MLKEKLKESLMAVVPIVIIVLFLFFTLLDIDISLLYRFLIGSVLVVVGIAIFLWGAELGIEEIGKLMGKIVARCKTHLGIFIFGSFLGFLITVAEPDLMILAKQIEGATGGLLNSNLTVISVAVGVGVMVGFGFVRILKDIGIHKFFSFFYALAFILFFFTKEEFHWNRIRLGRSSIGAYDGNLSIGPKSGRRIPNPDGRFVDRWIWSHCHGCHDASSFHINFRLNL
ncbi:hypothetical protein HMPREF3189_00825 [Clostridiales bacterium KA00134]|nr:hypothetical protein HMPREF3189_00825 [Clostridiales bacterium KA00134]